MDKVIYEPFYISFSQMNRLTKSFVLFVLLAFPVLIFIFLKFFGVNQFDLPVYYTQGVDTTFTDCEYDAKPHLVPSYDLPIVNGGKFSSLMVKEKVAVYYFTQNISSNNHLQVIDQLVRVQGSFENWDLLNFILITSQNLKQEKTDLSSFTNYSLKNWFYCHANPVYTNQLARCGFVLDFDAVNTNTNPWVILVDNKESIRGYYHLTDEEEVDRLIVEIKILRDNLKSL